MHKEAENLLLFNNNCMWGVKLMYVRYHRVCVVRREVYHDKIITLLYYYNLKVVAGGTALCFKEENAKNKYIFNIYSNCQ